MSLNSSHEDKRVCLPAGAKSAPLIFMDEHVIMRGVMNQPPSVAKMLPKAAFGDMEVARPKKMDLYIDTEAAQDELPPEPPALQSSPYEVWDSTAFAKIYDNIVRLQCPIFNYEDADVEPRRGAIPAGPGYANIAKISCQDVLNVDPHFFDPPVAAETEGEFICRQKAWCVHQVNVVDMTKWERECWSNAWKIKVETYYKYSCPGCGEGTNCCFSSCIHCGYLKDMWTDIRQQPVVTH